MHGLRSPEKRDVPDAYGGEESAGPLVPLFWRLDLRLLLQVLRNCGQSYATFIYALLEQLSFFLALLSPAHVSSHLRLQYVLTTATFELARIFEQNVPCV